MWIFCLLGVSLVVAPTAQHSSNSNVHRMFVLFLYGSSNACWTQITNSVHIPGINIPAVCYRESVYVCWVFAVELCRTTTKGWNLFWKLHIRTSWFVRTIAKFLRYIFVIKENLILILIKTNNSLFVKLNDLLYIQMQISS